MAKARWTQKGRIKLTLTLAEADFLERLLGFHIIGEGYHRTLSHSIWDALSRLGDLPEGGPLPTYSGAYHIELKKGA